MNLKKIAAERAAEYIQDGMKVGLGTGSTAYFAICRLGERVREGLQIQAVATSEASDKLAREWGIPIIPFDQIGRLDITIDGADEVDPDFNLIKGGGGALLREKIVAANSDKLIIVADGSKAVQQLGQFPLPVEVVPFASEWTFQALEKLGCRPEWRMNEDERYLTDNGNLIADCRMESIVNAAELNVQLNMLPGVVDNGLFVDMADTVILAKDDGSIDERHRS
ncbi:MULTISPECIES: ribose-5-phosphate isomerase RpiA [Paenibacillus]|uniref:ribose-5-phosphate isomerase RpiA n=1 Tax=Paenibacillus TaxID=44249 RepID=UPI000BA7944B|nr:MULTISPECIES: ribose-5-phosphate isomerase RpiA [Paenibacillus]MBE7679354.1 ribose-5-phosphate isomerase RpiA [Paenibacillus sp. P13VS]MBY0218571.1 ribose-5-phosphate isomerase RpiA [Paenibacillus illinoisensis]MCM3205200.1 ribose-5-phosphate isomerase RpiA [Paenibacillus illinoisensis]PAF32352.1 ribose 5-phosphate isomerase A [Paenibacillus sp. 7516]WJH30120.1 ribose-5-phosphate isomerase RpiA [Paenibacillus sp. CC-CFT742]